MLRLDEVPHNALRVCVVLFGLLWGSFLNVVIHRTPRGLSVVRPGSRCPACLKPIKPWDNIPVISWVVLWGKARCCKAPISVRYPLVEALAGAASLAVLELVVFEMPPETSALFAACVYVTDFAIVLGLVAAAFIDFEFMYLPDTVTLGGTVLAIATSSLRGMSFVGSIVAGVLGFLIAYVPFVFLYRMARGRAGMGLGDAKLLMMAGAFFGLFGVVWTLLAGAIQGTLAAFVMWALRGKIELPKDVQEELDTLRKAAAAGDQEAKEILEEDPLAEVGEDGKAMVRMAFGPFLAMAFIEFLLFHEPIAQWARQMFFMM
jgi:leader peptidase (prepilin peptidase) / N-methyltransferase